MGTYVVLKVNNHILLENRDTKANIIIGKISTAIIDILQSAGETGIMSYEELFTTNWRIDISQATANALTALAMPMKKPIRDQRKKVEEAQKKENKNIDAMDVLLGLASYN